LVLFLLLAALGMVLLLYQRVEALRNMSRRSRFGQQAEALALSALEEARVRLSLQANVSGSQAWLFLRSTDPGGTTLRLEAEGVKAQAAAGPKWPSMSVEPVSVRVVELQRKVPGPAGPRSLDWPCDFGYVGQVRLASTATVDLAERSVAQYYDVRLTNVRPPLPCDRIKLTLLTSSGLEKGALGSLLGRLVIDPGPDAPYDRKVTSFVLFEEPSMTQSFAALLPAPPDGYEPPAAAVSYLYTSVQAAQASLFPLEDDPNFLVLPEGISVVMGNFALPAFCSFVGHGVLACAGNLKVNGVIRQGAEGGDDTLVLQTLGPGQRLRVGEQPCEAALVALGEGAMVEPASGLDIPQIHGLIASAAPSNILTGVLVYDPLQYRGKADGPYAAPPSIGSPAPALAPGDLEPAAYRFTMAAYPTSTVGEAP
jgi:hypothetical protein